jgi:pyruvate dehydrogenase E2 component (dihydrolipoamide acetyltransferase)
MADRVATAWTAPHFFLVREVVATALVEMHGRVGPTIERRGGVRPTYTDLLVRLVAAALRREPRMNVSWDGEAISQHATVNIGIATAVQDGLLVPVIHAADSLTLTEVAATRRDLVDRAQAGTLRSEDVADGTFTISNLGMYNVDAFHAIVNPPQAGILAVGRLADRVVAIDGQPAVRPTLILTLSCDHRAIDGARAARFLDELAMLIEEPWGLLA